MWDFAWIYRLVAWERFFLNISRSFNNFQRFSLHGWCFDRLRLKKKKGGDWDVWLYFLFCFVCWLSLSLFLALFTTLPRLRGHRSLCEVRIYLLFRFFRRIFGCCFTFTSFFFSITFLFISFLKRGIWRERMNSSAKVVFFACFRLETLHSLPLTFPFLVYVSLQWSSPAIFSWSNLFYLSFLYLSFLLFFLSIL